MTIARHSAAPKVIVPATRTPRISDIVPGSMIFRWASQRPMRLVSEMPCHPDQMASIEFDPADHNVTVDQPVVCRRCFTTYSATPVPSSDDEDLRIVYRNTGRIMMSRPKRRGE